MSSHETEKNQLIGQSLSNAGLGAHKIFPPVTALKKLNGRAAGNCFVGVSAAISEVNGVVVLVAADVETLQLAWNDISTIPLDRGGVQRVAIFSQDNMVPNGTKLTGAPHNERNESDEH